MREPFSRSRPLAGLGESVSGTWVYLGLFIVLPLVIAAVLLVTVDAAVALVVGLIALLTFAGTGFLLGPGLMLEE